MLELIRNGFKSFWQMKINKRPFILSHTINSECNLKCDFCDNWRKNKDDLSKKEIFELIREAKKFGITLYNIWGTEPLLRNDLGEIIDFAKEKGLLTSLVTNGTLLENKVDKLVSLDYLTVSIDGFETHKEIRGVEVENIWKGIEKAKLKDMRIGINCVLNNKNLDEIPDLVEKCKKEKIPITFEPIYVYNNLNKETKQKYSLKKSKKYNQTINLLIDMKKRNYPIINSITYLKKIKNPNNLINCENNVPIIHIDSEGHLNNCRVKEKQLGSYKKGLEYLWEETKDQRKNISEKCDGCLFFGYIESKLINSLEFEPLKNAIKFT